jgi:putative hydrolase of the HAD superfamily
MSKSYRHLFFDLDHTLWDFDRNSMETLNELFDEYRLIERGIIDFQSFYKTYIVHNDRMWERFRNGYIKREDLRWKRIWLTLLDFKVADTALAHEMSAAYLELLPTRTALTPYAKEILDHCRNKYTMHLITNGFETTQWQKLQYSGIASYFSNVITSEKSNSMKPYREIFDYSLKLTGGTVEDSIMIGDALEIDVIGAINAGWDTVYYNPSKKEHSSNPTYEIGSWTEMIELF